MIPKFAQMWTPDQLEDFRTWEAWDKAGRTTSALKPLLTRLNPLIETKYRPYSTIPNMPQSAIKAEFKKHALNALEKYDPNRGVPLGHHVMRQMDGAKRFVYDHQNIARIPAHRARKVGEFTSRFEELQRSLGRPPTSMELADKLRWPVAEVGRMTKELRDDLLPWKGGGVEQAFEMRPPKEKEVLELLPYELNGPQQAVFEYTYGYGGKPQLGTGDIAKTMGVSASKISKLKAEIADKVKTFME